MDEFFFQHLALKTLLQKKECICFLENCNVYG